MISANFSHHLINAIDEIDSSFSTIEEIKKSLIDKVDVIRSDIKAWDHGSLQHGANFSVACGMSFSAF